KAPRGNKGAKVSRDLSFVGKNLIYLPLTDFLGISRKIVDENMREKLLAEADKLRSEGEGFIVRTAAVNASKKHLKLEAEHLKQFYRETLERAKTAPVGGLVYGEVDLPRKIIRDRIESDVYRMYVGHGEQYDDLLRYAKLVPDIDVKKLVNYTGERSMFREFDIADQVYGLCGGRVTLENGAYLIIDRTEAMTVIDVNTGSFTGESDLESTVFETNLLAAREIARQVRLRNVGGIVAVDFIDMTDEEHRLKVSEELEAALSLDRAKSRVLPMNDLCVSLFTRKRTNGDIASFFLKPCLHCTRQGYVLSDMLVAMQIRGAILDYFANGYNAVVVEMNRSVMGKILTERYFEEETKGRWKDKRVYMIPHTTFHEEKFTIRGYNSNVLT
ncbi:MAG: ribonuclease E/G, partial [Clostridiales bacterium]|nr:ribonuclease E/G [Clostridiales bacterium]